MVCTLVLRLIYLKPWAFIRGSTVHVILTGNDESLHWLTGSSIQTTLYITPWSYSEVEQMVWTGIVRCEGVTCLSDVTS